jgi:hypothetical protein
MLTSLTIQATLPLHQREYRPENTSSGLAPPISRQSLAVVFAGSMGVGGVFSPLLFELAVGVGSRPAIAAVYLFAAMLMVAVAVAVAPGGWWGQWIGLRRYFQIPPEIFPDVSGRPVEPVVPPISAF